MKSIEIENAKHLVGGLRLHSDLKQSHPGLPLVTIITATFNAADHLLRTIKSICDLTYDNIEWIILDGASSDNTVDLIRQNEAVIDYWVSEPDNGIYDAWNKGVSLARGEWIAFLGAGDVYKPNAINVYMSAIESLLVIPEFASSRVRLVNSSWKELRIWGAPFNWTIFKKYMTVAHVGALHHKSLFEKHGLFDTAYSSAADYEFLMRCGPSLKAIYLSDVTVDMQVGGISNGNKGMFETYAVQKKFGAGIAAKFRLWLALGKSVIRPWLRGY